MKGLSSALQLYFLKKGSVSDRLHPENESEHEGLCFFNTLSFSSSYSPGPGDGVDVFVSVEATENLDNRM